MLTISTIQPSAAFGSCLKRSQCTRLHWAGLAALRRGWSIGSNGIHGNAGKTYHTFILSVPNLSKKKKVYTCCFISFIIDHPFLKHTEGGTHVIHHKKCIYKKKEMSGDFFVGFRNWFSIKNVFLHQKLKGDLTNSPLRKLRSSYYILRFFGSVQWVQVGDFLDFMKVFGQTPKRNGPAN